MTQRDGLFFEEMSGPKAAYCCLGPRHLEIRLPVRGLERCPACHPERSEGSLRPSSQTFRCTQGDRHSLQMLAIPPGLFKQWGQYVRTDKDGKMKGDTEADRKSKEG